jgi:cysteinyl-tRNA synthetase
MPHATREIPSMAALIRRLLATGHGYRLPSGGVYYDVRRFPRYGALSRFNPARMRRLLAAQDDARLDDPRRRHPLDFALWRKVPTGPNFPSPFGRGRPGWHIECSAMAQYHLGVPVDIHGGGADLSFPTTRRRSPRARQRGVGHSPGSGSMWHCPSDGVLAKDNGQIVTSCQAIVHLERLEAVADPIQVP